LLLERDERILGSGVFVERILQETEERVRQQFRALNSGKNIEEIIRASCRKEGISQAELQGGSRRGRIPKVRIKIARKLVKEDGVIMAEAARHLGVSTSALSKAMNYCELLNLIKIKIAGQESLSSKIPFIEDIIGLNIKKAMYQHRSQHIKSSYQTKRPKINHAFISIHDHDYLDLINFLKRLEKEGVHNLTPDRTVFIFLIDDILSMSYETYRLTIKTFEKRITLDEYNELMGERQIFTPSYHKNLIAKLFQSDVLY
jgi:hypothetical protein